MGRQAKPARLWFDDERKTWCIVDTNGGNRVKIRLGLGKSQLASAEKELEAYIVSKRQAGSVTPLKGLDGSQVVFADVLVWGAKTIGPTTKRPGEWIQRAEQAMPFLGDLTIDQIDQDAQEEIASELSPASARRILEDCRSAWNKYKKKYSVKGSIDWYLPDKSKSRKDILTWAEAIALARVMNFTPGKRWRHMLPFLVLGLATATRSSRIYRASYEAEPGRPTVNLESAWYYRSWEGEIIPANKQAEDIPLSPHIVRWLKWFSSERIVRGRKVPARRYLVEYDGAPADCRDAWKEVVAEARKRYPKLFLKRDGSPKYICRHTLRHTAVSWMAQNGVPAIEICKYASMSMETFSRVYAHGSDDHGKVLAHQGRKPKPKVKKPEPETEDA